MPERLSSGIKTPFRERRKQAGLCALVFFAVTLGMILAGPGADRALYDLLINSRVRSKTVKLNPRIVSIDLDDESERILRESIDTRKAFAELLAVLADYNALAVMDFLFQYPKPLDGEFVRAAEESGALVLAIQALTEEDSLFSFPSLNEDEQETLRAHIWHIQVYGDDEVPRALTWRMPFPALAGAEAVTLGHVNLNPDTDGRYRRCPLFFRWEDGFIPSLSLAAAVRELGVDPERIKFSPGRELVIPLGRETTEAGIHIPVDKAGFILIPYFRPRRGTKTISLHRVIEALRDDGVYEEFYQQLNNRVAVVAEVSNAQKDLGSTSFEELYPLSGIHTAVLSGIFSSSSGQDSFFAFPRTGYQVSITLVLFLASIFCLLCPGTGFHRRFLAVFLFFTGLTFLRWRFLHIAPWYSAAAAGITAVWLTAFIRRTLIRRQEQILLKNALSRYFPRALAERIMQEGKTELIPEYKELTILFSDICGFTKWSSDKEPSQVHAFLSDYLESMSEIIFAHGGTVDKFMGDGMLSFFGDPFEQPDHVRRCIGAALVMQKKIAELAEKWRPLAGIDLKVRIGINTGKVVVGNLGTRNRIEYTVIGAAVNLAQRMESSASAGGILVTAETRFKAGTDFSFGEKRPVQVKGYTQTIDACEVLTRSNS
ncbi:MAG: adenylate/guanylate cyclase domain-containing protein [Treponema sp.]|jgi:adenylate cyclase|nr:adenylate/guanylate cyclase domain-containing protein [Treponema sp.]